MQDEINGAQIEATAPAQAPSESLPQECCGNCYFSRLDMSTRSMALHCRHKSPTAFVIPGPHGQVGTMAAWPPTQKHLWCGDYQPKASPKAGA